jgi:hypothetical protein
MLIPRPILLVFVDGLGWPAGRLEESLYAGCPALCRLLRGHAVPLETVLGVEGLPQSATNQTVIMTGRNAPLECGRHIEGFPVQQLRAMLEEDNLFLRFVRAGRRAVFANAYVRFPGASMPLIYRSVSTVSTLAAFGGTLGREELLAGLAVCHDLTREHLPEHGITDVPVISEEMAAEHLWAAAAPVDFCLFEYFLTDHAGHRGDQARQMAVLASLDRFLAALLAHQPPGALLLLVSDHGNIEAPETRRHTANPVPWVAVGPGEEAARRGMGSLLEVFPRILSLAGL